MKLPRFTLRDLFRLTFETGGMLLVLAMLYLHPMLIAQEKASPEEQEIQSLIAQLVSPNAAPRVDGPAARYPDDFDREAQAKVEKAWFKLYKLGPKAFPHLIPHLEDKRYSFTRDDGWVDKNWTVGRACGAIIACHLKPYGYYDASGPIDLAGGGKRWYRPSFPVPRTVEAGKEWWNKNKDRTLREMQVESIEWVIAEESKRADEIPQGDQKYLREMLAKLKASDQPLKPSFPFSK